MVMSYRLPPPPPGARPTPPVVTPARRSPRVLPVIAVGAVALVAAATGVVVGATIVGEPAAPAAVEVSTALNRPGTPPPPTTAELRPEQPEAIDVGALTELLAPSVVSISTDVGSGGVSGNASGTGVVLSADGEILTNAHVVDGASAIRVRLAGETEPRMATLLAADRANDLALLRVERTGLEPVVFADGAAVQIGQEVVAIGFALDLDGDPSITRGIISAVNRTIGTDFGVLNRLLQTDAAISSGNSGGPLVNGAGEVVGINTAVARGSATSLASNIGFAIASDEVLRVIESLREHAGGPDREEGYLGVSLADRTDGGSGALITEVQSDTPAAAAGIRADDVVLVVDDIPIDGSLGLIAAIRDREPGDQVRLVILRNGAEIEVSLTLEARPDS